MLAPLNLSCAAEPASTVITSSTDRASSLCQASIEFGPKVIATCRVPAGNTPRVYRFEAVFDGGHDDTRAGLLARRDGVSYDCEDGSKPELDGEYGTVRLLCRVKIAASKDPTQFDFDVIWYHADYTRVEFHAE